MMGCFSAFKNKEILSFVTSWMNLLQEGGPLPGPESGLLSNTWK